jgi:protein tyrosine phosphatase (PTP) superfamily phosphohydrolase (DUF442 family)/uncharacterized membrane protein YkoI
MLLNTSLSLSSRDWHRAASSLAALLLLVTINGSALAGSPRKVLAGVENFGQVTEKYYRGGKVTPEGVANLARLGVRTIIDLRDEESPGEPEACKQLGIRYYKFPFNGHATPDSAAVAEILSIVRNATEPVYVHCSAGKHRAGTICALYRMRVQGWSPEQAWAEQKSYGFGLPEEHPELFAFVYGSGAQQLVASPALRAPSITAVPAASFVSPKDGSDDDSDESEGKSKKSKSADDDDDDSKKDDDGDKDDEGEDDDDVAAVAESPADIAEVAASTEPSPGTAGRVTGRLAPEASYLPMDDIIRAARANGAAGSIMKIDLEWDPVRNITTWDVTVETGMEYEIDAYTGQLVGSKQKPAAKLAVLTPMKIDAGQHNGLRSFLSVMKVASAEGDVLEMELKQIKGRNETIFEVVLVDGRTLYYDARSGEALTL